MATESHPDYDVTSEYTNIVSTVGAIASVDTLIQNVSLTNVSVIGQASGSAPTGESGIVLEPKDSVKVNAAQVWVKAFGPSGKVSLSTV